MTLDSAAIGNMLLGLIGLLIVWLIHTTHSLKVEFHGMKESLAVRVEKADADHKRYDSHLEDHSIHTVPRSR